MRGGLLPQGAGGWTPWGQAFIWAERLAIRGSNDGTTRTAAAFSGRSNGAR